MTKEQLLSLPEPLRKKLMIIPQGATTSYFTEDAQSTLSAAFGEGWASVLGVSAE